MTKKYVFLRDWRICAYRKLTDVDNVIGALTDIVSFLYSGEQKKSFDAKVYLRGELVHPNGLRVESGTTGPIRSIERIQGEERLELSTLVETGDAFLSEVFRATNLKGEEFIFYGDDLSQATIDLIVALKRFDDLVIDITL